MWRNVQYKKSQQIYTIGTNRKLKQKIGKKSRPRETGHLCTLLLDAAAEESTGDDGFAAESSGEAAGEAAGVDNACIFV